jgi:hypothetical protein
MGLMFSSESRLASDLLHGVLSQKVAVFIATAVRTSNRIL